MAREKRPTTKPVTIRFTEDELGVLNKLCKRAGLNRSETIRHLVLLEKSPISKCLKIKRG